jgi:hypothetical protein
MAYVFQIEASIAPWLWLKAGLLNNRSHILEIIKSLFERQENDKTAQNRRKTNHAWGNHVDFC